MIHDSSASVHPWEMSNPNGSNIQYYGISQRLHIATEITKSLILARPHLVMTPQELINEAYVYADLLMATQHVAATS